MAIGKFGSGTRRTVLHRFANWRTSLERLGGLLSIWHFSRYAHKSFPQPIGPKTGGIILVELNTIFFCHPSYLVTASALQSESPSEIVAYAAYPSTNPLSALSFTLRSLFPAGKWLSYRAIGASRFHKPRLTRKSLSQSTAEARQILEGINSKGDLEKLTIKGVLVGDLLYGSMIGRTQEPTVDLRDPLLLRLLAEFISLVAHWETFFTKNKVRAVIASHTVYEMGLPLRIAAHKGVESLYLPDKGHALERISTNRYFQGTELLAGRALFEGLETDHQHRALRSAEVRLARRLEGGGDFDLNSSAAARYRGDAADGPLLFDPKDGFRVMIAPHLFYDSVHRHGPGLFPDIREWLWFVGEVSEETNFNWYLKAHPDGESREKKFHASFLKKFPHMRRIPSLASHHQILREGIGAALTVHGQIAFEYAYQGVTVVNASLRNPHAAYEFSITPQSIQEYRTILQKIDSIRPSAGREQVLEYYFMKSEFFSPNIFYPNYHSIPHSSKDRGDPRALQKWQATQSMDFQAELTDAIRTFLRSKDTRMYWKHYGLTHPHALA